jgi:hypothetical protein
MKKLLTTILIYFSITTIYAQKRIFGKVVDTNKNPLIGASVYLNNTSVGTTTDENGEFYLLANEGYDLVASYLGYYSSKLTLDSKNISNYITFKLSSKVDVLDEVVIKKKKRISRNKRAKYLRMFKQEFIGKTNLSKSCSILNEEVLEFDYDPFTSTLEVYASKPLIIKNAGLGYLITYDLVHFQLDSKEVTFLGYTKYEPLKGSQRKKNRWEEKRLKAYYGSKMHFLRTINYGNLKTQGFVMDLFERIYNPNRPAQEKIDEAKKLIREKGGLQVNPFKRNQQLDRKLAYARDIIEKSYIKKHIEKDIKKSISLVDFTLEKDKKYSLKFSKFLRIFYTKEPEEKRYQKESDIPFKNFQTSIISLNESTVRITASGVLEKPLDVFLEGYWAYEKIADALPLDYQLD